MCKVLAKKSSKKKRFRCIFSLTPVASPYDATYEKIVFHKKMPFDASLTMQ